jgi:hypothetical protein
MTTFGKEFGGMAQGDNKTGQKGTNSIFVMNHIEIALIPGDRVVTYAGIVVDHRPQKEDPNHIRMVAGGNLIKACYQGELTMRTADLTTSKIHCNSVLIIQRAKYMCLHIKHFYLLALLNQCEYMKIPIGIGLSPPCIIEQYNLLHHVHNGYIYLEMRHVVWGLPQAGILTNTLL